MMHCLTISHKTAPVEIRALFAYTDREKEAFLAYLLQKGVTKECVVLNTCNRCEVYFTGEKGTVRQMEQQLAQFKKVPVTELMRYFHVYHEEMAVRHLYKVACGMDSMVLGEDEILGQVKEAFFFAREREATGYYLNTIFQDAITCAKRIKTDTNVSKIPISVATLVANEVVQYETEENLDKKVVLIIGISGKMGTTICKNLHQIPGIQVYGTVRTHHAVVPMLEEGVQLIAYDARYEVMNQADIIISVTSSPHYTITRDALEPMLLTKKKRLFLDLSVPMDIDKEIHSLPGVQLYDIDYFEQVSNKNNSMKRKELHMAEAIMESYMEEMKKTLVFHEFMGEIPRMKRIFEKRNLESILYDLRDHANSEEFKIIMNALKQL